MVLETVHYEVQSFHFLCSAAVSIFGCGLVFKPDNKRFNSAIARPGFKP